MWHGSSAHGQCCVFFFFNFSQFTLITIACVLFIQKKDLKGLVCKMTLMYNLLKILRELSFRVLRVILIQEKPDI